MLAAIDLSSTWLIGLGALLAGCGSFLSGWAALNLARKRGRNEAGDGMSEDAQHEARLAAKDVARDIPDDALPPEGLS